MTSEQFEALQLWVANEARYAADEIMNRNDCSDEIRRRRFEDDARKALVKDNV